MSKSAACRPNSDGSSAPAASPGVSRREFLICLGSGAAATIAGYFLTKLIPVALPATPQTASAQPRIRKEISARREAEMYVLEAKGHDQPLGAVNSAGWEVLQRLDGSRSIQDITSALAAGAGLASNEAMEGKVACFVAQLGEMGLLQQPYYVQIVEARDA